jgi:thymidylate kinase
VRATYLELARAQPQRFCVVDAARELPQVEAAVERALESLC